MKQIKSHPITYAEVKELIMERIADLDRKLKKELAQVVPNPRHVRSLEEWKRLNERILRYK
jgi:hypothetical protein